MRARLLIGVTLTGALALGACGGGSSKASEVTTGPGASKHAIAALIAAAPDKTTELKSARMSMVVSGKAVGESFDVKMQGRSAFDGSRAEFTMDLGALGGTMEMRAVDGTYYVKTSMLGDSWFSVKSPIAAGVGNTDPTGSLEALRGVSSDIQTVGREPVRGTDTTHYHVTIDLAKALDKLPERVRAKEQAALEKLGKGTLPADVWIADDGTLRRMTMDIDFGSSLTGGKSMSATMSMEMYDFGVDVSDIAAPPASEVRDFGSVAHGILGSPSKSVAS